jgi:hypothetical protein
MGPEISRLDDPVPGTLDQAPRTPGGVTAPRVARQPLSAAR